MLTVTVPPRLQTLRKLWSKQSSLSPFRDFIASLMVPTKFLLQKNWKLRRSKFLWPWHGHCQHEIEWCMQNWKIAKLSVRSSWNSAIFVEQPSKRKVEFQWRTFVSWYLRPASQPSINNWPPISIARYMASSVLWMKYIDTYCCSRPGQFLIKKSRDDDDQTHLQNDVIYCIVCRDLPEKTHNNCVLHQYSDP